MGCGLLVFLKASPDFFRTYLISGWNHNFPNGAHPAFSARVKFIWMKNDIRSITTGKVIQGNRKEGEWVQSSFPLVLLLEKLLIAFSPLLFGIFIPETCFSSSPVYKEAPQPPGSPTSFFLFFQLYTQTRSLRLTTVWSPTYDFHLKTNFRLKSSNLKSLSQFILESLTSGNEWLSDVTSC